jgi:hypothetical protein
MIERMAGVDFYLDPSIVKSANTERIRSVLPMPCHPWTNGSHGCCLSPNREPTKVAAFLQHALGKFNLKLSRLLRHPIKCQKPDGC